MRVLHLVRKIAAFLLAGAIPVAGAAQSVRARIIDSTTAQPISGVIASAIDSGGRVLARSIANEQGRLAFDLPVATVQLKVQHIGFRARTIRKQDINLALPSFDIALSRLPTLLQSVQVSAAGTACGGRSDRATALALLEQVREGLPAAVVARDVSRPQAPRLKLARYERAMERNTSAVVSQRVVVDSVASETGAFHSPRSAAELLKDGFVSHDVGQRVFAALDADVLLSDEFSAEYCFHMSDGDTSHRNQVGLGFAAAKTSKGLVTIAGTVWVDTLARSLHSIEYRYAGLDGFESLYRPGGVISFRAMPDGSVLIDRWSMRLVSTKLDTVLGRTRDIGYDVHEIGGELLRASWPSGLSWSAELSEAIITVRRGNGEPAPGVAVTLRNTSYTARTDANGIANIADIIPATYSVVFADSVLAQIALPIESDVFFEAKRSSRHNLNVSYSSRFDLARDRCAQPVTDVGLRRSPAGRAGIESTATLFVYVIGETGGPAAGVQITDAIKAPDAPARWRGDAPGGKTDPGGRYVSCSNFRVGDVVQLWVKARDAEPVLTLKTISDSVDAVQVRLGPAPRRVAAEAGSSTVRGIAFDSLHNEPLRGAMISVEGTPHSTFSDENGAFRLDSLGSGLHTFTLVHAALDSIDLAAITSKVDVDSSDEILLALPSFASLWRNACGPSTVPSDSGFIYGSVRNADGTPVRSASVSVNFFDLGKDSTSGVRQRQGGVDVRTNDNGSYAICGTPMDLRLKFQARFDSNTTDVLDLPLNGARVQRRDVVLSSASAVGKPAGRIRGVVRYRNTDTPVVGARILVGGRSEVRAGSRGEFLLSDIPIGTRQIEVMAVGVTPFSVIMDVDTAAATPVNVWLERVTTLASREVNPKRSGRRMLLDEMELRRERGIGTFVDSLTVQRYSHTRDAFRLNTPGGVRRREPCRVFIDGVDRQDLTTTGIAKIDPFWIVDPTDVAVIEFHSRGTTAPIEFKPKTITPCDIVIIWTKHGIPPR